MRRRLVREGELLLELAHPHIVRAYELRRRPRTVLVLETLGGETVEHMIQSAARRLAIADVAHLGLQICSAIGYLHGHGYLHLDLKPSNVIVESGQARVIDLSLSAQAGAGAARDGVPPVPRARAGPRGDGPRAATDVWGIGVTLYEAATGDAAVPRCADRSIYPQRERRAPLVARKQARTCRVRDAWSTPACRRSRRTGRRWPSSRTSSTP